MSVGLKKRPLSGERERWGAGPRVSRPYRLSLGEVGGVLLTEVTHLLEDPNGDLRRVVLCRVLVTIVLTP